MGGTIQQSTGLTTLGAREYDADTGRFISADPIIDYDDPQQINGYAYANNSPVTFSDATGLRLADCEGGWQECGPWPTAPVTDTSDGTGDNGGTGKGTTYTPAQAKADEARAKEDAAKKRAIAIAKELGAIIADELGITDTLDCFTTGALGSCGATAVNVVTSLIGGGPLGRLIGKYGWRLDKAAAVGKRIVGLGKKLWDDFKGWRKSKKAADRAEEAAEECNGFMPHTKVLMADGTTKDIKDVDRRAARTQMAGEMSMELIISPRGERVREELADAAAWSPYAAELRQVLGLAIEKSGADFLEVGELLVSEPLPDRHLGLFNGVEVQPPQAIDLVEGMAAGRGPYCRLSAPGRLLIESGWDGAVHLYTTRAAAAELAGLHGQDVIPQWRDASPESAEVSNPVDAVADESFWASVAELSERLTLLCERWAHGAYGCRWFRVTRENAAELAGLVRPRSLVCVATEPELHPRPELLEDDFTAFVAPLAPGELVYRAYPGGADTLSEVKGEGFSLMLADSVMGARCAVVPDSDGVNRAQWESPGEP